MFRGGSYDLGDLSEVRVRGVFIDDALRSRCGIVITVLMLAFFRGLNIVREAAGVSGNAVPSTIAEEMARGAEEVVVVQISAVISVEAVAFKEPLAWSGSESLSIFSRDVVFSYFDAEAFPVLVLSSLTRRSGMFKVACSFLMATPRKVVLAFASSVQGVFVTAQFGWRTERSSPGSVGSRSTQCFGIMNEGTILPARAAGTSDIELAWTALIPAPKLLCISISISVVTVLLGLLLWVWRRGC